MIEGLIGKLVEIELIEDIMLEIRATHGILRIDLTRDEIEKTLKGKKRWKKDFTHLDSTGRIVQKTR